MRSQSYQFRLPLMFCMTGLVAVGLTGVRVSVAAENNIALAQFVETVFSLVWIVPPTVAVLVLFLRRDAVIFPIASALLLSTALSCHAGLAPWAAIVLMATGLLLGSGVGLVRVLWQRITMWRVALSVVCWFYLGIFGEFIVKTSCYSWPRP